MKLVDLMEMNVNFESWNESSMIRDIPEHEHPQEL